MNNLLKSVAALQDVRRAMQNNADPCILAALDAAIAKLEAVIAEGGPNHPRWQEAVAESLAVLGDLLTCAGAIAELVKTFNA